MDFKIICAAFLIISFIYFILVRAINTKNYKRKSFFLFIAGFFIVLIFVIARIIDIGNLYPYPYGKFDINYYSFLIVSIAYNIIIPSIYYIKGYKRKQRFKSNFKKQVSAPTIKNKKEFLYIIMRNENDFLLNKKMINDEEIYSGIIIKFPHNEFFHDELIRDFINQFELDYLSYKCIGKVKKDGKIEEVYYCYKIIINEKTSKIEHLSNVNSFELMNKKLSDFDKKILFTSIIEEDFEIKL